MRLLDCGCGPGSITAGLAAAVAPGIAVGVDIDASIVYAASARGAGAERYLVSDVGALPFADSTFDVVFAHALLQHLPEPLAALREMRRVLKPSGLAALVDADYDGSIIAPDDPALGASMDLLASLRRKDGRGDSRVGKHLRSLLHQAGFVRTSASARADWHGSDGSVRRTGEFWADYLASPALAVQVSASGLASPAELREMAAAWRRWSTQPGAFWATFWCQAFGWKP